MRKLLLATPLLALGLGCSHIGGECDCLPVPGDSTGHNPHVTYHSADPAKPVIVSTPAPVTKPVTVIPPTAPITSNSFEPISTPKNTLK
jgi:hypothetical protein